MELRKMLALALGAGSIVASVALPAGAHGQGVCVIAAQNANVSNVEMKSGTTVIGHPGQALNQNRYGLYYPVTDPVGTHWTTLGSAGPLGVPNFAGDDYTWVLNGLCANGSIGGGGSFLSSGTGIGYCGRSIGLGTGTITGGHSTIIRWESGASQLVLTHPSAIGSVNAQPNPAQSSDGSCVSGTAVKFLVDGALVHAG